MPIISIIKSYIQLQLEASREECGNLATKLAAGEARVQDAERRTEALATLQSHRWMEFSKMADNMKELSGTMVSNLGDLLANNPLLM